MNTIEQTIVSREQVESYQRDGYLVVRGVIPVEEAIAWRDHFMELHAAGPVEGYFTPIPLEETGGDLLRAYPRMLHPHKWDETCKEYTLDGRLHAILRELLGEEPLAAQSMLYFKPPGARGQALHQDDYYLKTQPRPCLAAWMALDETDAQNGGLSVVPGSHNLPVLCPHPADLRTSFTIEEVDVPEELAPAPIELGIGDVLFFNGSVIHGSGPNTSTDRFRRSFICHYVASSTDSMSSWYSPLRSFDDQPVEVGTTPGGGPCGTEELAAMRAGIVAQMDLAKVGLEQGAIGL